MEDAIKKTLDELLSLLNKYDDVLKNRRDDILEDIDVIEDKIIDLDSRLDIEKEHLSLLHSRGRNLDNVLSEIYNLEEKINDLNFEKEQLEKDIKKIDETLKR